MRAAPVVKLANEDAGTDGRSSEPAKCHIVDFESMHKNMEQIQWFEDVVQAVRTSSRILILTGAGISVSSGIPVSIISDAHSQIFNVGFSIRIRPV